MSKETEAHEKLLFAEKGLVVYTEGQSSVDEVFCVIQSTQESVISISYVANSLPISSLTIPAGFSIYGILKNLTVTSGSVVAYKR